MTWWAWLSVFVAIAAFSVVVAFLLVRSLWRGATALLDELSRLGAQTHELSLRLEQPEPAESAQPEMAVFTQPVQARQRLRRVRRDSRRSMGPIGS